LKVYVEVDLEVADLDLLLRLARAERMPLDALIKRAIAEYVERAVMRLAQQAPGPQTAPSATQLGAREGGGA
jgi:predicted transcriptional regulator